jgi:hypothetical protein
VHRRIHGSKLAFTLIDLLVIVAVVAVIGALLVTGTVWLGDAKGRSGRINCVGNLKQCELAFSVWAGDNGGRFPMEVSTNSGGTLELVPGGNAFRHFQAISNELGGGRVLLCPSDAREGLTNFLYLNNLNISYFAGLDANTNSPQNWLCGDRNLTNGIPLNQSVMIVARGRSVSWTREMHDRCGNIGFADESVQRISNGELQDAMQKFNGGTNRIALPE